MRLTQQVLFVTASILLSCLVLPQAKAQLPCFVFDFDPVNLIAPADQRFQLTGFSHPISLPFSFAHSPDCGRTQSYSVTVDGGPMPPWLTLDSATPRVIIDTTATPASHPQFVGIFSVVITASLNTPVTKYASDTIEFTVTFDGNSCVLTRLVDEPVTDMYFMIRDGEPDTVQIFDEFLDHINPQACGPRLYNILEPLYVTSPAPAIADGSVSPVLTNNYMVLTEPTRTLTIQTTDPTVVGTHKLTFTAQQENYPRFNPVTTILKYFEIEIDAHCHYTEFIYISFPTLIHEVGAPAIAATTHTFADLKDNVSLTTNTGNGYDYCGARQYDYTVATDLTSPDYASPDPVVSFNAGSRTFTLQGTSSTQYGEYDAQFHVSLPVYPGFGSKTYGFKGIVVPPCSQSVITPDTFDDMQVLVSDTKTQTFSAFTHSQEGEYNDYCGPLEYSLVGGDTNYLKFDVATFTLTLFTDAIGDAGNYLHKIQAKLTNHPAVLLQTPAFKVDVISCPTTFAAGVKPTDPTLVVIEDGVGTGDGVVTMPFTFPHTPNDPLLCPAVIEYYAMVNETTTPAWGDIDQTDPAAPSFVMTSTDSNELGRHRIKLWAEFTNVDPRKVSTDTTEFTILTYASQCLHADFNDQTVNDMFFTIGYQAADVTQTFPTFTDTITAAGTEDCGPRLYTLSDISGTAVQQGIIVVDIPSDTLTVQTIDSKDVGTYTIQMTVEFEHHPFLNDMKIITKTFTLTIDDLCSSTVFNHNEYLLEKIVQVGKDLPLIWKFPDWTDSVSESIFLQNDAWYCEARSYTITSITSPTNDPNYVVTNPPLVEVNSQYKFFSMQAFDETYVGVHKVTIGVELQNYVTNNPHSQDFLVYVLPSCNTTTFETSEPLLENIDHAVVQQEAKTQRIPQYFTSVELQSDAWGFGLESCGNLTYTLKMQNDTEMPDFIKIVKYGADQATHDLGVHVRATEDEHVGIYELYLEVSLNETEYVKAVTPLLHPFNVTVEKFPYRMTNELPYPLVPLFNESLHVDTEMSFMLWPFDSDEDEVTTEFIILTSHHRAECPSCFKYNRDTLQFDFRADRVLSNTTSKFEVKYNDHHGLISYFFEIFVEPIYDVAAVTKPELEDDYILVDELPEDTSELLTPNEEILKDFSESPWGYLLSGKVLPHSYNERQRLADMPFIIAYVSRITNEGNLTISFTDAVVDQENWWDMIHRGMLRVDLVMEEGEKRIPGRSVQAKNLNISDYRDESDRRGLAVISKEEFLRRQEEKRRTDFNWTVTSFTNQSMEIYLQFEEPDYISTFEYNSIEVSFPWSEQNFMLNPMFEDIKQSYLANYTAIALVPRQTPSAQDERRIRMIPNYIMVTAYGSLGFFVIMMLFACTTTEPLQYFWSYMNFLQLLVHMPLLIAPLPGNVVAVLTQMFPYASLTNFHPWNLFRQASQQFTATSPYSVQFDLLGYQGANMALNIGTIVWIPIAAAATSILAVLVILIRRCKCCKNNEKLTFKLAFTSIWLRITLQMYLVLGFGVMLSWVTSKDYSEYECSFMELEEWQSGDRLSFIYFAVGLAWVLLPVAIILFLTAVVFRKHATFKDAEREAAHASEILFMFGSSRAQIMSKYAREEIDYGYMGASLKQKIKDKLAGDNRLETYLALQELSNPPQPRTKAGVARDKIQNRWKLKRIKQLQKANARKEDALLKLGCWTGEWAHELRRDLKEHQYSALMFNTVFMGRRIIVLMLAFYLIDHPLFQIALYASTSLATLAYLLYVQPFTSGMRNFQEIVNETVIYLISFVMIGLFGSQPHIEPSYVAEVGWNLVLFIMIGISINWIVMIFELIEPFRQAMHSRKSAGLGRCLRFCCKVKLPQNEACLCNCCTCGTDADENPNRYPKTFFFSIHCQACPNLEGEEPSSSDEDEEAGALEISSDEDGEEKKNDVEIQEESKIEAEDNWNTAVKVDSHRSGKEKPRLTEEVKLEELTKNANAKIDMGTDEIINKYLANQRATNSSSPRPRDQDADAFTIAMSSDHTASKLIKLDKDEEEKVSPLKGRSTNSLYASQNTKDLLHSGSLHPYDMADARKSQQVDPSRNVPPIYSKPNLGDTFGRSTADQGGISQITNSMDFGEQPRPFAKHKSSILDSVGVPTLGQERVKRMQTQTGPSLAKQPKKRDRYTESQLKSELKAEPPASQLVIVPQALGLPPSGHNPSSDYFFNYFNQQNQQNTQISDRRNKPFNVGPAPQNRRQVQQMVESAYSGGSSSAWQTASNASNQESTDKTDYGSSDKDVRTKPSGYQIRPKKHY